MRGARGGGKCRQGSGVEAGYVSDIVEVDVLEEVTILGAFFDTDILMLVIEVLTPLGDADGGETFEVEAGMVAAAKLTIAAEDEYRVESGLGADKVAVGSAGRRALGGPL